MGKKKKNFNRKLKFDNYEIMCQWTKNLVISKKIISSESVVMVNDSD